MSDVERAYDLSIVIPAYAESAKIEADIRAAHAFVREERISAEVIVVDDGSPDDTAERARQLRSEFGDLRVLSYTPNRGKGHALRYGMCRTRGRNVLFADAGLCVPYSIAKIALAMLDMRMCDIAHGSRRMRGSVKRAQPLYRQIGSRVFGVLIHTVMGIPLYISDTQCGFKAYRGDVARDLYAQTFTDGFMFDTEIIMRALADRYTILEFPVVWHNDADTRFNPRTGSVRILRELLAIRTGLRRQTATVDAVPVAERDA